MAAGASPALSVTDAWSGWPFACGGARSGEGERRGEDEGEDEGDQDATHGRNLGARRATRTARTEH